MELCDIRKLSLDVREGQTFTSALESKPAVLSFHSSLLKSTFKERTKNRYHTLIFWADCVLWCWCPGSWGPTILQIIAPMERREILPEHLGDLSRNTAHVVHKSTSVGPFVFRHGIALLIPDPDP